MDSISILLEDADFIVIDKPAGMVVNQAKTVRGLTVQAWMAKYLIDKQQAKFLSDGLANPQFVSLVARSVWREMIPTDFDAQYGTPEEIFNQRWGIVHRLDKDTGGVLVLAKHPGSLIHLLNQFKQRQTKKEYLALVHGQIDPDRGEINLPLGRSKSNFKKIVPLPDGRMASTAYQVITKLPLTDQLLDQIINRVGEMNHFSPSQLADLSKQMKKTYDQGFCWVKCQPKTGRMHQIRVHLTAIHHPLVGDPLYLGRKRFKLDRLWTCGQVLQAIKLEFEHPSSGEKVVVTSDNKFFLNV